MTYGDLGFLLFKLLFELRDLAVLVFGYARQRSN
jgi:hypothetical protein